MTIPSRLHANLRGRCLWGNWDDVPIDLKSKLQNVLSASVEKSVAYDPREVPECYIENVPGDGTRCKKEEDTFSSHQDKKCLSSLQGKDGSQEAQK